MNTLTHEQLERAAKLYCKLTVQDPDELVYDVFTKSNTLPRYKRILERMASNQVEKLAMLMVAEEDQK